MNRVMADATHASVLAIPSGVPVVAGYVTGSPDILWTPEDWALFPGSVHVTIDQGFTGSPVPGAVVRDVETGAWSAASATGSGPWTAARPTIYCNQDTLPAVLAAGWQGCLWLAIDGWQPGQPLPAAPGCTIIAVQNEQNVSASYDLSVVLDPYWPMEAPAVIVIPINVDGLNAMRVDQAVAAVQAAGFTPGPVTLSGIAGYRPAAPLDPSEYGQHLVVGASMSAGVVSIDAG